AILGGGVLARTACDTLVRGWPGEPCDGPRAQGWLSRALAPFAQAGWRRRPVRILRAVAPAVDPRDQPRYPCRAALQAMHEALRRDRPRAAGGQLLTVAQEPELLSELLRAGAGRLQGDGDWCAVRRCARLHGVERVAALGRDHGADESLLCARG